MAVDLSQVHINLVASESIAIHQEESADHGFRLQASWNQTTSPAPEALWTWVGSVAASGGVQTFDCLSLDAQGWVGEGSLDLEGFHVHWILFDIPLEGNALGGILQINKTGVALPVTFLGDDQKMRVDTTRLFVQKGHDSPIGSANNRRISLTNDGGSAIIARMTICVGEAGG